MPVIRVSQLTKDYPLPGGSGVLPVLRGIDLTIGEGELVAIVGPSGAGKSTLLHLLGGLDRPTSGAVHYGDAAVFEMDDDALARFRNAHVGFVFQFHHLLPEFTALENVAIPALMHGDAMRTALARAATALEDAGLADRSAHKPAELSGGEQQRVAVARALINGPDVVLADEPTGNLDSANAERLHDLLTTISRTRHTTFVIVTHNAALAARADRVLTMRDGRVES